MGWRVLTMERGNPNAMRFLTLATLCWRGSIRPLLSKPRSALLGIASVALGVTVFLAITIANRGAVASFHQAFAMITGHADLEIRGTIDETIFPKVAACKGVEAATPLVEGMVTLPDWPGESIHLVGIDPFTAQGLLTTQPEFLNGSGALSDWLGWKGHLAVTPAFLKRHGMRQGDKIRLQGPGVPKSLVAAFVIRPDDASAGSDGRVAAIDLAEAQEWLGQAGKLTAILIKVRIPEEIKQVQSDLRSRLPADVTIEPPARRTRQVDIMLSAFTLNLTALSLVSLMVGMFFVGNASAAAVVRRRVMLGILRAVGTTRTFILGMVLTEAAVCGLLGSLLGVLASPLLAGLLAAPVARTVTALYLPVDAHGGWPTLSEAVAGVAAGVLAAVVAALIPARQAAGVDPTRVLHPGAAPEVFPMPNRRLAMLGCASILLALLCSLGALHAGLAFLGFGAAFLVLAGTSLMVPLVTSFFIRRMQALLRGKDLSGIPVVRISLEQTIRSMHRSAPTIAALAAAAAMTVGISVMIHSFRGSVISWTERTLTADLFIAPAANELLGLQHTLPESTISWWKNQTDVSAVGTFREFEAKTPKGEQVTLGVVSGPARGAIDFLHGDIPKKTESLNQGKGVALSESLARRLGLGPGEKLQLTGPGGTRSFPIIDLYRDYTRDRGIAMIGADWFASIWGVPGVHSLAVEFKPGISSERKEATTSEFLSMFGGKEAFVCYRNRELKDRILEIFNQTFAVTAVLKTISIVVAVVGVMLTLGILVIERTRDLGVLKAMGASRVQIGSVVLVEAALIGWISSLIGLLSGAGLALVLTWVINKAFFGWSIDLAYPLWEMLLLPGWMILSSLLAGFLPAMRAANIPPGTALRME
jgi:putative ABC transport system permease protein